MNPDKLLSMEQEWKLQRPDLPVEDAALIGLLTGTGLKLVGIGEHALKEFDLITSEHDLLACLRRKGKPYAATPKQLLDEMIITSGALTTLANRMIKRGLIIRSNDINDRRSKQIALTTKGKQIIDDITTSRYLLCEAILQDFSTNQKTQLKSLLLQLLATLVERN